MTSPDDDLIGPKSAAADVETLIHRVSDVLVNARPLPLSNTVRLDNRDEVVELLEEALVRLPEELRAARWLLREREEFLAKMGREGDDILDAARQRAERMVQRTEVVRAAESKARKTVEDADAEARRLRHEAEDYCDQKLAQFEIVLERTLKAVQAGRARLAVPPIGSPADAPGPDDGTGEGFFDQDARR